MKFQRAYRSTTWMLTLTALLMLSGNASAVVINIGGFSDNGSLSIMFEGTEQGGDPNTLEYPFPDTVTSFSAEYSDEGLVGPFAWDIFDLGSLVYNSETEILESLSAFSFPGFIELSVGDSVLDPLNYVEIYDLSGALLTSSSDFPNVPLPAAAWLFISALGGLFVAKRRQLRS